MTQNTYLIGCISRAADYIAGEIRQERTPALADIAAAAGLSKYHFHRLYALATGETCQQTIMRLRLARAADTLKDPQMSVTDAALDAGYGSSQAFAKSIKRLLHQSASDLRADPERLASAIEDLSVPALPEGAQMPQVQIQLASLDPFDVIAVRTDGAYPALNAVYWSLFEAAGDPRHVEAIIGLPHGSIAAGDDDANLRFDCGLKLSAMPPLLPDAVEQRTLPGGTALLARHLGPYDDLTASVDALYKACLSLEVLRLADQPCRFHYLDDPEKTQEAQLRTDIYLPIAVDISQP